MNPFRRALCLFAILLLALTMSACTSTQLPVGDQLLGVWRSSLGGFTVESTFTENDVTISGHQPKPYTLEANQLLIDGDRTTIRIVSFPSNAEMLQTDVTTGTSHLYHRVTN